MAMMLELSNATEKKKTLRDRIWEATVTRLGCMDYQWQMRWRNCGLSLKTEVDLEPLPEENQYVVYTTIVIGPFQMITYDVGFGKR
ncbi:hypothetical protein ACOI1H_14635 [Loktanella sp. DJP18]|uniref:hypothetical protein n=1 Tax=Loktanella sp. DJP18 TaxID=3409788 RepID=UPI003BB5BEFB